jgi:hypothetical protein
MRTTYPPLIAPFHAPFPYTLPLAHRIMPLIRLCYANHSLAGRRHPWVPPLWGAAQIVKNGATRSYPGDIGSMNVLSKCYRPYPGDARSIDVLSNGYRSWPGDARPTDVLSKCYKPRPVSTPIGGLTNPTGGW